MNDIKIKGHIENIDDAKEIFNEVVSNVEKHWKKIYGFFSISFENQLGTPADKPLTNKHSDTMMKLLLAANKPFSSKLDKPVTLKYVGTLSKNRIKIKISEDGKKGISQTYILSPNQILEISSGLKT